MVYELKLSDIAQGAVIADMPEAVKPIIGEINRVALDFPDSVINLRMSTYEPEKERYRMYFAWETDRKTGSSVPAYVAYDSPRNDFFNWMAAMTGKEERFSGEELIEYFRQRFSRQEYF